MIVRAMSEAAISSRARAARFLGALFIAGALALALASCSSNPDNPIITQPPVDDHPAPNVMFHVVGDPRVAVRFTGNLVEAPGSLVPTGQFAVTVYDSVGRRIFLTDVRLNGVVMTQELDPNLQPSRYLLDPSALPGLAIGDTIRLEVVDGGVITTPFTYIIVPSHLTLPPDSTVIHKTANLVLPWTGAVERVLVNLTDSQGTRLRANLQLENYTGEHDLFIPARDLAGLSVGDVQVGTDVLDTELIINAGQLRQDVSFETRQSRFWRLEP
jgi:hypothetical protein